MLEDFAINEAYPEYLTELPDLDPSLGPEAALAFMEETYSVSVNFPFITPIPDPPTKKPIFSVAESSSSSSVSSCIASSKPVSASSSTPEKKEEFAQTFASDSPATDLAKDPIAVPSCSGVSSANSSTAHLVNAASPLRDRMIHPLAQQHTARRATIAYRSWICPDNLEKDKFAKLIKNYNRCFNKRARNPTHENMTYLQNAIAALIFAGAKF
jgi:hypothetical protein